MTLPGNDKRESFASARCYHDDDCDLPYDYRYKAHALAAKLSPYISLRRAVREIEEILIKLPSDEIEDIYRLNN
jgi:hypothetical protein